MPPNATVEPVTVIGGGLAGCEAAWQLAERGVSVVLVEMKPVTRSPAHKLDTLCELVCSNSLRSDSPETGPGLLKEELRHLGSLVIELADEHRVPAGSALAVDREAFGKAITERLSSHTNIRIDTRVADEIPAGDVIVATGPLTHGALAETVKETLGGKDLYFYDAIAPIVDSETIDWDHAFRQSRYDRNTPGIAGSDGQGDYINCPLDREQYDAFVIALRDARKVVPRDFEEARYFEGCLPAEVIAERGHDALTYGPMRPVGLTDPKTGKRPHAVVQLRPENRYLTSHNLVGFQTRLAYPEQKRVFAMIPALKNAEFLRFGSIHRNTYIDSPRLLGSRFELRDDPRVRFAGLITGVEGYIESCAVGLLAGMFLAADRESAKLVPPPPTTALGALHHHVTAERMPGQAFSPTNINFGLFPPVLVKKKRERRARMVERARDDLAMWREGSAKSIKSGSVLLTTESM